MLSVSDPAVLVAASAASAGERLLTFLTRDRGAVRLYAPGPGRGRRGRPASWHEPLQGGELGFARAREGAPGRLRCFQARRVWPGIREHFGRLVHALAFLETLRPYLTEGVPQEELFDLLVQFLDRLESEERPGIARAIATLRLLALSGFAPRLAGCVGCGRAGGELFSPEAGGVLCRACAPARRDRAAAPLSPAARRFMESALGLPGTRVWRLRGGPQVAQELCRVLGAFHAARTGESVRAAAFLAAVGEPG